jgi:release factor glutamine methyltransferase
MAVDETVAGETWQSAVTTAASVLEIAGCDTPRLDAELLLAEALGVRRTSLYLTPAAALDGSPRQRFDAFIARRAAREPVAYILGRKDFRRLSLLVDRRVLIPRPETELLVEVGLTLAFGARVADVGTGSGAVALALKDERPDLVVSGIDVSADAVAVADANARRLGLDVRFTPGDLLDGAAYDAVLANLPYVADAEELPPEIARYEPAPALYGGHDGLDVVRRLIEAVAGSDVGLLALEVGAGQADAVARDLDRSGFGRVERRRDLAGHERVVLGRT